MRILQNIYPDFVKTIVLFAATGIVFGIRCGQKEQGVEYVSTRIVETSEYIEVTGIGAASPGDSITEAAAKRNAEIVAYVQAIELLSEILQGVAVQGEITIRDLYQREGIITQVIQTRLRGVRQVGSTQFRRERDGSITAFCTVRYEKKNAVNLMQELLALKSEKYSSEKLYTGIIIDIRHITGYTNLLTPMLESSDGDVLFTIRDIEPDILLNQCGISVFSSVGDAVRFGTVGERPLIVIPKDYNRGSGTLILSNGDSRTLKKTIINKNIVKQGKIALIL